MPATVDRLSPFQKSWLDRSLSLVTDVRAGEGGSALLLAANVFCLLAFYSVLKVVRESLILSEGGAEVKSYAAAGQALLLLAIVPAYGVFASSVNRLWLVCGVTLFFASHLLLFYLAGSAGVPVVVCSAVIIDCWSDVGSANFTRPKSSTLTKSWSSCCCKRMTLAGLRSRWMMRSA